jgi:hypothetical protein
VPDDRPVPKKCWSGGWVKLHRQLLEHPRFDDPGWVSLWIFMLLKAAHKPVDVRFGGHTHRLSPGSFISSRHEMAAITGLNASKVQRLLESMKIEQQIEQQTSNKSSMFTVLNWASYQKSEQQNEQQSNNRL